MGFRDVVVENCSGCGHRRIIAHKHLNLCLYCNTKRKNEIKKKKGKTLSIPLRSERGRVVAQDDNSFFRSIWNERPHFSEVSGEFLGHSFKAVFMSHVLPKSIYPKFRYLKRNIVLMSFEEHDAWGNSKDQDSEEFKTKFSKVIELRDQLKKEYYQKNEIECSEISRGT